MEARFYMRGRAFVCLYSSEMEPVLNLVRQLAAAKGVILHHKMHRASHIEPVTWWKRLAFHALRLACGDEGRVAGMDSLLALRLAGQHASHRGAYLRALFFSAGCVTL